MIMLPACRAVDCDSSDRRYYLPTFPPPPAAVCLPFDGRQACRGLTPPPPPPPAAHHTCPSYIYLWWWWWSLAGFVYIVPGGRACLPIFATFYPLPAGCLLSAPTTRHSPTPTFAASLSPLLCLQFSSLFSRCGAVADNSMLGVAAALYDAAGRRSWRNSILPSRAGRATCLALA